MQITINLPDELVQHLGSNHLEREVISALVVQAYKLKKLPTLRWDGFWGYRLVGQSIPF